ncbi:MAG TPA: ribonuclease HI family protein [Candidatus Methanofastidiosa archaeon]|nr:ribonuclease HI family protein [Candidatus Methanofastidiosa archaeon]HPR41576.1 ribonuclease HI family protein [Candidatus Methanofastidiosa archaeon]
MENDRYTLYTDGAARGNPGPGSWAYVLTRQEAVIHEDKGTLGTTTNNIAEYTAIIKGLGVAREYGILKLRVVSDSQLAINQLNRKWKVRKPHLMGLFESVVALVRNFDSVEFVHMPRETDFIKRADMLANLALDEKRD